MPVFTDQTGQPLVFTSPPKRIVSLVPSQTELLYDLGLDEVVVGITKFCIHPESWFRKKTRVGGTKQLKMDIIHQLQPDLIIANKEENVKEQIEELAQRYRVWISDVNDLESACDMIRQVSEMTGTQKAGETILHNIHNNFKTLDTADQTSNFSFLTCYLIWQKPYMTVGRDTFIHAMLGKAGFENLFGQRERYPEVSIEQLQALKPQLLLLSSEPFPFRQAHADELSALLPGTKVALVDGEMFSWYGSRLQNAPPYFAALRKSLEL
jgi:ABC-type Fe3+-hydroxamate transport system substrate-binding protein